MHESCSLQTATRKHKEMLFLKNKAPHASRCVIACISDDDRRAMKNGMPDILLEALKENVVLYEIIAKKEVLHMSIFSKGYLLVCKAGFW